MALVTIARCRGQDHLADAPIEAEDGGEMPARQLLEAARRPSVRANSATAKMVSF